MSLDKAIIHKKEYRKPYHDSRRFDRSCRNHGNCGWCVHNRTFSYRKNVIKINQEYKDWDRYDEYPYEGDLDEEMS